jgi:hypothetical protein
MRSVKNLLGGKVMSCKKNIHPVFAALLALLAASVLLASCKTDAPAVTPVEPAVTPSGAEDETVGSARYTEDGRRIITIGTWYNRYYVSKHTDIYEDASVPQPDGTEETDRQIELAQTRLAKMRELEEKYNIVLEYVNLTYEGIQESISTSIPEGMPDVDIYETELQFGVPAVLNGYAVSLEDLGLAGTDVFTEQVAMKNLSLMGQSETYLFSASVEGGTSAYVLAFNMDLIRAAGLENPQDIYDRGEWTWDVWRNYLKALTRDLNGNGELDVYGYSGYWTNMLTNLLYANNTGIATGERELLDSAATKQVLDYIYTLYNVDHTARPWDTSNWQINNKLYAEGMSGFWIGADWIFNEQGGADLPFEIGVVPWPYGPNGNPETNKHSQPPSKWYFIPEGTEDPRLVYDVIYDWTNWYDGDRARGEDNDWSRTQYMSDRNFEYAAMMASKSGFDLWESLMVQTGFSIEFLLSGELTADGIAEQFAQAYQDELDRIFT